MVNLLTHPLLTTLPLGTLTLPGVLAALGRDEVESFPALRPHQGMFWHMFLVQLGALALHGTGRVDIPTSEEDWRSLLRGLTKDFPGDEPWHLVVEDVSKPAFMQPSVPATLDLKNAVPTPDALDLLITSRNHDLKQAVAQDASAEDWVFALITLQTGEGYGGAGNQGIARMNGGSSSRPMLSLAPLPALREKAQTPRPGAWFRRDLSLLLADRNCRDVLDFPAHGGLGLTWLANWPEDEQLQTRQLDPWFIDICRRVRLRILKGQISALKGTSKATRINGKHLNGNLGDPWAPIHKSEGKNFTLGDEGDFTYSKLTELLFAGDWALPLLAKPAPFDTPEAPLTLVAQALARGNSKTGGFKARFIPLSGKLARTLWSPDQRKTLHEVAKEMANEIAIFDKGLSYALVLTVAGGERENISRESYAFTREARAHLDRYADSLFFEHLWGRYEAEGDAREAGKTAFLKDLWEKTQGIFDQALPAMPCASLYRPRAEVAARGALIGMVMKSLGNYFKAPEPTEEAHDTAR
jgi:CRISPR system Cascade subunit CasA